MSRIVDFTIALSAILFGLCAGSAKASDWWAVGATTNNTFFVDYQSIALVEVKGIGPTIWQAWAWRIGSSPTKNKNGSSKYLHYVECKSLTTAIKYMNNMDSSGNGSHPGKEAGPESSCR